MNRVPSQIVDGLRWRDVVGQSSDGLLVSSHVIVLPFTQKSDNKVSSESRGENLGEEIYIRDEGSLQNDRNVASVEQLNRVWLPEASLLSSLQLKHNLEVLNDYLNITYLEINNDEHDQNSSQKITDIWRVLSLECLVETIHRVRFS